MIPHAIRYTKEAIQQIYKVPRGKVAEVSLAIKGLAREPRPLVSFEIDIPNTYAMKVSGYFVTYEIVENEHYILVLVIEKDEKEG